MMEIPPGHDESEIVKAFIGFASAGPRAGVAKLKKSWMEILSQLGKDGAVTLVHCLACKGHVWLSELRKAVGKKGKLTPFKDEIALLLRDQSVEAKNRPSGIPFEVLRAHRFSSSTLHLEIDEEDLSLLGLDGLLAKFPNKPIGAFAVNITFRTNNIYIPGLAAIAAWCARYGAKVTCQITGDRARRYLSRVGFLEEVVNGRPIESVGFDCENFVALTSVARKQKDEADAIAGRIADLFSRHNAISSDDVPALKTALAEMVENVYKHAESNYPAYVLAQAHPNTQKLSLAIADTGIGIQESFRRADNHEARKIGLSPKTALEGAVAPLVTSKLKGHRGYGLFVLRKLVELNKGQFRLTSDEHSFLVVPGRDRRTLDPTRRHHAWKGTFVSLLLDMKKSMDMQRVYRELPVPAGFEDEDFFQ